MMYIFYALLAYLLYRLVTGFIIPLYRTTRRMRRGLREMQEKMRQAQDAQNAYGSRQPASSPHRNDSSANNPPPVGEYIDFEEVK